MILALAAGLFSGFVPEKIPGLQKHARLDVATIKYLPDLPDTRQRRPKLALADGGGIIAQVFQAHG